MSIPVDNTKFLRSLNVSRSGYRVSQDTYNMDPVNTRANEKFTCKLMDVDYIDELPSRHVEEVEHDGVKDYVVFGRDPRNDLPMAILIPEPVIRKVYYYTANSAQEYNELMGADIYDADEVDAAEDELISFDLYTKYTSKNSVLHRDEDGYVVARKYHHVDLNGVRHSERLYAGDEMRLKAVIGAPWTEVDAPEFQHSLVSSSMNQEMYKWYDKAVTDVSYDSDGRIDYITALVPVDFAINAIDYGVATGMLDDVTKHQVIRAEDIVYAIQDFEDSIQQGTKATGREVPLEFEAMLENDTGIAESDLQDWRNQAGDAEPDSWWNNEDRVCAKREPEFDMNVTADYAKTLGSDVELK